MNSLLHPLSVSRSLLLSGHTTGLGTRDGSQEAAAGGLRQGWVQRHSLSLAEGQASQEGNWILPLLDLSIFIIYFLLILILKYCTFILIPSLLPGPYILLPVSAWPPPLPGT